MKRMLLGLALAAAGGLVACGGGTPQPGLDIVYDLGNDALDGWPSDQPGSEGNRDSNPVDPGPCEDDLAIEFFDEQDDPVNDYHYVVSLGAKRDLRAKVHACGKGVEDVGVSFELLDESYEGACSLDISYTWSIDGGLVIDGLQGGDRRGDCMVEACLDDGETCVIFNILVFPKDPDPLIVAVRDYQGEYLQLDTFKVLLFKEGTDGNPRCDDLVPGALPTATTQSGELSLQSLAKFKQLPKLDQELTQTYAVLAQCWESKDLDKTIRAYGCKDDIRVEWGAEPRYVEIDCTDIPPRIVGSYDLLSTFDLVSGLPPGIALVVNVIIGMFQNPTGQIMLLLCHPDFGGVLGEGFCGYLFNDTQNPTLDNMAWVGDIVSQIINAILMGLLADNCPSDDPELCTNIVKVGADVGDILKKFQLVSTMTCTKEPDKNGLLPMGTCREVWHTMILKWTLGKDCDPNDDACGAFPLNMNLPDIGGTVTANIEAQLLPGNKLAIAKHPLDLKYGALVNVAIEKILLPQIFGNGQDGLPAVDSYEDLIGSLLAGRDCIYGWTCCTDFAASVVNQTGNLPGLTTSLIEGACDALIFTGSEYLRSRLLSLDATPQNFTIGTPIGDPCQLYDHDRNMRFDSVGAKNAPCNWDAGLSLGGAVYDPKGTFYGPPPKIY